MSGPIAPPAPRDIGSAEPRLERAGGRRRRAGRSAILARSARRRRDDGPFAPFAATRLAHVLDHAARGPHAAAPRRHRARSRSRPARVWWDGELFSGAPDWAALLALPARAARRTRERAFLDGPVEELCRAARRLGRDHADGDLPPRGLGVPEARALLRDDHPRELRRARLLGAGALRGRGPKLASRSVTAAVTVMVPNSLGPAELLLHYGTDEQKRHYLPRLARGEEIPCFALTGPEAGSDAAATQSEGVVCRGKWRGPGGARHAAQLAQALHHARAGRDADRPRVPAARPGHLLGDARGSRHHLRADPARRCPASRSATRHDPMGVPFQNGPTPGDDVFVPLDAIIGGRAGAGQGWRMLMECLAAGRSISLPSLSVGAREGRGAHRRRLRARARAVRHADRALRGHRGAARAHRRRCTYPMDAARRLTAGAVDAGEKPAVLSAIVEGLPAPKRMRDVVERRDGHPRRRRRSMRGPRNMLARVLRGGADRRSRSRARTSSRAR